MRKLPEAALCSRLRLAPSPGNTKKRYGKHREEALPLPMGEDTAFKKLLRDQAAMADLLTWPLK